MVSTKQITTTTTTITTTTTKCCAFFVFMATTLIIISSFSLSTPQEQLPMSSLLHHSTFVVLLLAPIAVCLVTSIYCLKCRLEAQGSGTNPYGPTDAPLELVFTIGILWTLFCAYYLRTSLFLKEIATISWLFIPLYIVLVVVPWSFPSLSPSILGCKLPPTNRPDKFRILAYAVLEYGTIKERSLLALIIFFGSINSIAMGIEDYLFPVAITDFDASCLAFILGHPRSGTTNLHKSLANHPKTRVSTFCDLFCSAGSLRWCMEMILKPLLHALVKLYDSPHHKLDIDEELEEHMWLLFSFGTNLAVIVFPSIIQRPDFDEIYKSIINVDDVDMLFLKRILARRCNAILKHPDEKYIAKPIFLTQHLSLLRHYFPCAKYIICARNRQQAVLSQLRLFSQLILGHDNDLEVAIIKKLGKSVAVHFSKPTFLTVEDCVSNQKDSGTATKDMEVIQFSAWTTKPEQELANLLKFLELEQQTVPDNCSLKRTMNTQQLEKALSDLVCERTERHEARTISRVPSFVQLAL